MRLILDSEKCQGHGRCYALAPDLFDADEEGYSVLLPKDGTVPEGLEGDATLAVDNCPEYAITTEG